MLLQFMQQHSFIVLTGATSEGSPVATQLPVLISRNDASIILEGHMMRNTDHHNAFMQNQQVLALFTGPHAYVSASWYSDKRQASTWNYMTVHAHGKIVFTEDRHHLIDILDRTTALFENDPESEASYKKLPEEYINQLLPAIVSFKIQVLKLEHVFKLSQNRDEESHRNIIGQLNRRDKMSQLVAEQMQQHSKYLTNNK